MISFELHTKQFFISAFIYSKNTPPIILIRHIIISEIVSITY